MDFWGVILEIVLLLGVATLAGTIFERLGQQAIIGYLLAGVLLGPSALGIVENVNLLQQLAEVGVALLLFTIGLEFSWRRLKSFGGMALLGGTLQIGLTAAIFTALNYFMARPFQEVFIVGAAIALSSTAVVLRVLSDRAELDSSHGRTALGILLTQDLAVVPLLLVITALGNEGATPLAMLTDFGLSLVNALLLGVGLWLLSRHVFPSLIQLASAYRNRDFPVLLALSLSLGATWVSHALGLSPILGAFLAGMLLAESPFAEQIRADVIPLQAAFLTLFFTSVGTLAHFSSSILAQSLILALGIILIKALVITLILRLFKRPLVECLAAGLTLAQIGEFSFVLAELGFRLGLVEETTLHVLLSTSVLTLAATPYLIASLPAIADWWARADRKKGKIEAKETGERRVIVVGYGPAGRAVVTRLDGMGIPFVVVDLNPKTVAECLGTVPVEFGDASRREILEHVGIANAPAVVVTLPDPVTTRMIISQARHVAPEIRIVARSRYHIHRDRLIQAGADLVADEEDLVGQRLAEELKQALGPGAEENTEASA